MASKQIHYNIDNISKENANINLIYRRKVESVKVIK
jgi:hypothetical protein